MKTNSFSGLLVVPYRKHEMDTSLGYFRPFEFANDLNVSRLLEQDAQRIYQNIQSDRQNQTLEQNTVSKSPVITIGKKSSTTQTTKTKYEKKTTAAAVAAAAAAAEAASSEDPITTTPPENETEIVIMKKTSSSSSSSAKKPNREIALDRERPVKVTKLKTSSSSSSSLGSRVVSVKQKPSSVRISKMMPFANRSICVSDRKYLQSLDSEDLAAVIASDEAMNIRLCLRELRGLLAQEYAKLVDTPGFPSYFCDCTSEKPRFECQHFIKCLLDQPNLFPDVKFTCGITLGEFAVRYSRLRIYRQYVQQEKNKCKNQSRQEQNQNQHQQKFQEEEEDEQMMVCKENELEHDNIFINTPPQTIPNQKRGRKRTKKQLQQEEDDEEKDYYVVHSTSSIASSSDIASCSPDD